jgi:glutamine cyclotransferase
MTHWFYILLFIHKGTLVEGTGLYGKVGVRIYDIQDGTIHNKSPWMPSTLRRSYLVNHTDGQTQLQQPTVVKNITRLAQLTWKAQTGFIYDIDTLRFFKSFGIQRLPKDGALHSMQPTRNCW